MAGDHAGDAELLLRRLIRLRDDGLLGQADQDDVWMDNKIKIVNKFLYFSYSNKQQNFII